MSDDSANECPICMCGPMQGKTGKYRKVETPCHHTFHARCLKQWNDRQFLDGNTHSTCPICRANTGVNPTPPPASERISGAVMMFGRLWIFEMQPSGRQ